MTQENLIAVRDYLISEGTPPLRIYSNGDVCIGNAELNAMIESVTGTNPNYNEETILKVGEQPLNYPGAFFFAAGAEAGVERQNVKDFYGNTYFLANEENEDIPYPTDNTTFLDRLILEQGSFFVLGKVVPAVTPPTPPPTAGQTNQGILLLQRVTAGWYYQIAGSTNYTGIPTTDGNGVIETRLGRSYVHVPVNLFGGSAQYTASGNFNSWDTSIIPANAFFTVRYQNDGMYVHFYTISTGANIDPLTIPEGTIVEIQFSAFL